MQVWTQFPILSTICKYLTFEQALRLKIALQYPILECPIAISDCDLYIPILPRIDNTMIQIYRLISSSGSNSALLKSIGEGKEELAIQLLNLGANVSAVDKNENAVLINAIMEDLPNVVRALIDRKADIGSWMNDGVTPILLVASRTQNCDILRMLLEAAQKTPDPLKYIDDYNWSGYTPLMYSLCFQKHGFQVEMAKLLLAFNSNIETRNPFTKETALNLLVTSTNDQRALQFLIDSGADIETRNRIGRTPLHQAVDAKKEIFTKILLDYRANVNTVDKYGSTPLMLAARHGHLQLAKMLVEDNHFRADIHLRNQDGKTAQEIAINSYSFEIAQYLADRSV